MCCRQALKPTELLLYSNISISEYPLNAKIFSKLSRSRENKRITCNESLFNACMHHHLSESVCFRFDTKSHGCLWDRLHHNLYMPVAMGTTEVLTGITVFYCYLKIFLFVRETRNNVSKIKDHFTAVGLPACLSLCL